MDVSIDLSVLISKREWDELLPGLPDALRAGGVEPIDISIEPVTSACTPENILVAEYMATFDEFPASMDVYRVIVNAKTDLPLGKASGVLASALPAGTLWYGSSELGHTEFGLGTTLAWRAGQLVEPLIQVDPRALGGSDRGEDFGPGYQRC
ncbi:hypothetical protein [uncultured Corynebacterium sp.]|uniref:hypothetical protein n=1 Tax=uncultured Corynebacterium sp. TaxID=159447 RepID=UPI0025DAE12B|nr:hypothetical protein [uncultured Corynebacterium sp.]